MARRRYELTPHQQRKLDAAFARADREAALRKQDGRCKYCFCKLNYRNVTRDHVRPRSAGGSDQRSNIVAACERCNNLKGRLRVELFLRLISDPWPGEFLAYRLVWMDRRINKALMRLEKNLMRYAR